LAQPERDPILQDLARRVLETGKFDLVQIWFESAVLDRYRGDPDSRILRTDADDALIHMPVATARGIPEGHRAHWLEHVVGLPAGGNFLRMAMTPGACIDDGQARDW
jgi:hypothetical protein